MRLTERDHEILLHIHRHRFLRSDHVTSLLPGSERQILRRLQRLYHHGYLERPRCQIDYYHSGSRRMVYGIGMKAAKLLNQETSIRRSPPDWQYRKRIGRLFLEHALLISDFMVRLEIACRKCQGIRLLTEDDLNLPDSVQVGRNPFRWRVSIPGGPDCTVIPDRVFGLEQTDGTRTWFVLEADRGTMPVTRQSLERSSFRRKMLAYQTTWAQQLHHQFGWQRFRVLTITTGAERIRAMIEACRRLKHGQGVFLFADANGVRGQSEFFSLRWHTVRSGQFAGLLEPNLTI